jgi:class 3 adenylate cyclase/pimeloyl-ACP methyl ester carboxylesterase
MMQCPRCRAENRDGLKFCEDCGTRLGVICSQCGAEVTPGKKFCGSCGAPIAGQTADRFASPQTYTPKHLAEKILTSKSALEGERKQVTVLFADLKGSMELLADCDPEEARKLLDPILERMMEAVHHYEGTVNQVMGDGIMALFGAPIGHEDHAVRGCYAALRMQRRVTLYADEIQRGGGTPLQIRVGLNSGEVVVRAIGSDLHMDYTAVGQTTHLAARMEQMAKPGSALVTGDTLKLAEGFVQVRPLGAVPVKGLETPTPVYELTGIVPARSRFQASTARGLTRFVGRDGELQQLAQALERAAAGHGQTVAVVGEAGVGKSRLVWEFARSHRTQGWLVLESGSVSYGKATSYLPVIDLLKAYCGIQERDNPRAIRERMAGKLLMLDRALEPLLTPLLALLDVPVDDAAWDALDPPQRRQRTLEAVKRLLLRESQVQPLLLIFEDLHWIDAETQALLDGLIESLPTARVLLLVNYRPEYQHGWGSKTYYTQLRIDPLPPEGADALLTALLGGDHTLEPLRRALIARTEGNPFFLEEGVRTLVETQVLVGDRGAYRLTKAPEAWQIPATAQAVLAARIDRLAPEDKRLLQAAAVIGKDVPFALLQAIADVPEDSVRRGLTHLQAAEFLYETNLFPDLEYTFKHAYTHEVAYGSVLHDRRRTLHGQIVAIIERLYRDRLPEHVERLASHATAGELWAEAAAYHRRAAEKAKDRYAYRRAIHAAVLGLDAATRGRLANPQRACLVVLGDLHSLCGELPEANERYEQALSLTTDPASRTVIANKRHRPHRLDRQGTLAFYEHGSGAETLLIINPLVYGLATFQPLIEELAQEFRIVTIDPRGTGASDPLPDGYTLRDHMEDVGSVIEALDAAPVIGIGISRGGNLLVKLAVAYPGRLKKIVTVGTPKESSPLRLPEFEEALRQRDIETAMRLFVPTIVSEPGTSDVVELLVQQSLQLPPETVLSFFRPDPERNIVPLLEQVRVPTLVVHGTADLRVSFEEGRYLAAHIPEAQLYPFEGLGHLPIFTARREFCEALRRFVRTGRARPEAPAAPGG